MTDYILVSVVVAFPRAVDGSFPGIDAITEKTSAAVKDVFSGAGLELWGVDKPPVVTVKKWRVLYSASLRASPSLAAARLSYAEPGEVLTQVGEAQPPDWINTERGWILSKQVAAV
jgi:hypothetical protein